METAIGPNGEGLVFLLGLPRSGTTLLSMMLDNHPDVASPPEPWLMLAFSELGRVSVRHPANASILGTAVQRFAGADGFVIGARAAARALYGAHLEACGKRILVDKTPRYWLIPEFLIEVFPSARFIWLRRDPMDIAASYSTTWGIDLADLLTRGSDIPESFDLTIGLDRLMRFHERHPNAVHVVSYEHLTAAPASELAAILRHIDLEVTPALLNDLTVLDASNRSFPAFGDPKILATKGPHTNSIGVWRKVLTPAQLQVVLDAVGADKLRHLGYADTLAALKKMGIYPSGPSATARLRATAKTHLAAREADIVRSTTHDLNDDVVPTAEPHVRTAGKGKTTLAARLETRLRRLNMAFWGVDI